MKHFKYLNAVCVDGILAFCVIIMFGRGMMVKHKGNSENILYSFGFDNDPCIIKKEGWRNVTREETL